MLLKFSALSKGLVSVFAHLCKAVCTDAKADF